MLEFNFNAVLCKFDSTQVHYHNGDFVYMHCVWNKNAKSSSGNEDTLFYLPAFVKDKMAICVVMISHGLRLSVVVFLMTAVMKVCVHTIANHSGMHLLCFFNLFLYEYSLSAHNSYTYMTTVL